MKVTSLEIVDPNGLTVLELDGNFPSGMRTSSSRNVHDQMDLVWPLLAASVDNFVWICTRGVWVLASATSLIAVSGGSSAAVMPVHCAGGVAIGSGTDQLSAALDLEETAPNRQTGTLIASPTEFRPGDALGLNFSGTLTALVGALTVSMRRIR